MAEIPRVYAQQSAELVPIPRPNFENTGADVVFKALREQEQLEERQRLQTYEVGVQTALTQGVINARTAAATKTNPDEYQQVYENVLGKTFEDLQASTGGDAKRGIILGQAYNSVIRREADNIAAGVTARHRDQSLANILNLQSQARTRALESTDPSAVTAEIQNFNAEVDRTPFLFADEQEKLKEGFKSKLGADWLGYQAVTRPFEFDPIALKGQFDPKAVETAFNLAQGKINQIRVADERADRELGEKMERVYEGQADRRQLDEAALRRSQAKFNWSEAKVQGYIRQNMGLRLASPVEEKMIADALEPINKLNPSPADVREAQSRLSRVPELASTPQYRQAQNQIRARQEDVQGPRTTIKSARNTTARRIHNILEERFGSKIPNRYKKQLGAWRQHIDTLNSEAELKAFEAEVRQDVQSGLGQQQKQEELLQGTIGYGNK